MSDDAWEPVAESWYGNGWRRVERFFAPGEQPISEQQLFEAYLRAGGAAATERDENLRFWFTPSGAAHDEGQEVKGEHALRHWPTASDGGFEGYFARVQTRDELGSFTAFLRFNVLDYLPEAKPAVTRWLGGLFKRLRVTTRWYLDAHVGRYDRLPFLPVHQDGVHNVMWVLRGEKSIWTWRAVDWLKEPPSTQRRPFESATGCENVLRPTDLLYFSPTIYHTGSSPQPSVTLCLTFQRPAPTKGRGCVATA